MKNTVLTVIITAIIVVGGVYLWQGKQVSSPPAQPDEEQKVSSLADCSNLSSSWALFSGNETSLSFCYQSAWGDLTVKETGSSQEARTGTVYYLVFPNSVNNYPLISYSTLDYKRLGDSDVPPGLDWKGLDFDKSNSELALLFPDFENAIVQKFTVNGRQVLKVHRNFIEPLSQERITPVDYFMPDVTINGENYNLHIIFSPEQESDIDTLLETMSF